MEEFLSEGPAAPSASAATLCRTGEADVEAVADTEPGPALQGAASIVEPLRAEEQGVEAFSSEHELRRSDASFRAAHAATIGGRRGRDTVALARLPDTQIDAAGALGDGSTQVRQRRRFGLTEAAVVFLCLAGLGEIAWIGWAITAPRSASRAAVGNRVAPPPPRIVEAGLPSTPPVLPHEATTDHVVQAARVPPGDQIVAAGALPSASSSVKAARAPLAAPGGIQAGRGSGWLAVSSGVPLEIFEQGRRLGSSKGRLALSPGRHQLEAVNAPLGIRVQTAVNILAGRTSSITIPLEPGIVNINAVPWASVRVDDTLVGDTPLANLRIAPGKHVVVFSHPALGERRTTVTVPSGTAIRVSMNLTPHTP